MTLKKVSISVTKLTCTAKPSTILGLASILCATTGKGWKVFFVVYIAQ
jgi:hypothetical protein